MALTDAELVRSHRMALGAFFFGSAATILINLAHAENGWGPKLTAIIAPISVLFVAEMLLHAPTIENVRVRRILHGTIGAIGFSALTISYAHTADLLMKYGENPVLAWLMPVVPDGMMVVSSICLAFILREKEKRASEKAYQEAEAQRRAEEAEKRRAARQKRSAASSEAAPKKKAATKPSAQELQEQARRAYLESEEAGSPLGAQELAERFGRKETWGRAQIRAAREMDVTVNLAA